MRWDVKEHSLFPLIQGFLAWQSLTTILLSGLGSPLHTPETLKPGSFLGASWAPPPSLGCQATGQHAQKSGVAAVSLDKSIREGFFPGPMHLAWSRASAYSPLLSDLQQTLAREGGLLIVVCVCWRVQFRHVCDSSWSSVGRFWVRMKGSAEFCSLSQAFSLCFAVPQRRAMNHTGTTI